VGRPVDIAEQKGLLCRKPRKTSTEHETGDRTGNRGNRGETGTFESILSLG
jgi:hypothetical protein